MTLADVKDLSKARRIVQNKAINSINMKCHTHLDAVLNSPDQRTIVINNVPLEYDMERLIKQVDQISPVLAAEYINKYNNPQLIQTDELLQLLRSPEFMAERPDYLIHRESQIHERGEDQINVIHLTSDFKPKKTETYSFILHKEAFPKLYSPSYIPEESINKDEPMVFKTVKARM